ncbi:ataxin-7-like protein 1 isoform X2 [Takifugu rubripes]|uniref:ataxin-7-like protein 1 isoform X2 n=1 Tax=Takifugu rubripes TaxID=31033 RepID=UPI001145F9B9|nr:ataxin-7-like protein 1 isoform X2 [Takifugu rubripes]
MATLDRQIPSLDTFLCEPWSSFVSAAKLRLVDNMLRRRHVPALEELCLVVCHVCSQVVTPQGILAHYEKRHISPVPSRSPLVPMKPKTPAVAPSPGDTLAFRVPKDYPHSRFSKAPLAVYPPKGARSKTCVSLPVVSLEKMPCLKQSDSASHLRLSTSSPSSLKPFASSPSQRSSEKLLNGRVSAEASTPRSTTSPSSLNGRPSPARSPLDRKTASTPSPSSQDRKASQSPAPSPRAGAPLSAPLEKRHQNGTKSCSRSQKRLSGRVFDPNKHCGVQDPETKRPCTRSLTCKTHSLTHRRAVPGRRKHFDVLLAEHKGRPKEGAKDKEKERDGTAPEKEGGSQRVATQETASPSKPHCPNGRLLSSLKLRLANAHIPRVPGPTNCTISSAPPAPAPGPATNPEPSAHIWAAAAGDLSRLSSDEGDAETAEDGDRPAFHFSNHHPQPLGCCVFSSRLLGRGYYVFDRRWDRMRLALQNMVEKHLNAQMWRKVPLAPESFLSLSCSGTSPITSQPPPSLASVTSPSSFPANSLFYTATFPQSASAAGVLSIRDAAQPAPSASAPAKSRNGAHRASRPPKDAEDTIAGSKKRKNNSAFSPSYLFPSPDNHKRNGSSYHSTPQGSGGAARKKGLGGGGLWSRESVMSKGEGSQSRDAPPAAHQPPAPRTYEGGKEWRKRRSPTSFRGKASKLSRPDGLESLFGNRSDSGGILTSGPESQRQVTADTPPFNPVQPFPERKDVSSLLSLQGKLHH